MVVVAGVVVATLHFTCMSQGNNADGGDDGRPALDDNDDGVIWKGTGLKPEYVINQRPELLP